jgi:hypothetical protein
MLLLRSGLVLHITGIALMVGGAVASFMLQRQLWKILLTDREKAMLIAQAASRLKILQESGAALVLTGGIMMMVALHGVVMQSFWFRTKLVLLGLIILNEVINAKPALKKLRVLLVPAGPGSDSGLMHRTIAEDNSLYAIRERMRVFYILQFLFFLMIFILSVFQPA